MVRLGPLPVAGEAMLGKLVLFESLVCLSALLRVGNLRNAVLARLRRRLLLASKILV